MSTDKGPPQQAAPTDTTNTNQEAALLDELWNEAPHNDPQTLKDGVLAIIRQLKREHKVDVDKIKAEHDHHTKLARIDHLNLVVGLMEDIQRKEAALSKAQLEKKDLKTLHDHEIKNLKKEHQEAIQGYVQKEKKLEADKAEALQSKQMASSLQQNSIAEAQSLRQEVNELHSTCLSLQQDLSRVTQREERKGTQLFNVERKRREEKEELQRAESCLESMKPMEKFLEKRDFLSRSGNSRPLSWLEMEWAIRAAAYGARNIPVSSPTTPNSLINSSRQLAKLTRQNGKYSKQWRSAGFFECAHDLVAEILETVQTSDHVRRVMANDAHSVNRILDRN
ncbi:hypothetical protein DIS24_g9415 [Lasiodiplodia hormozganensis]|uniref:Uncharacterized protein n=1 Tax=Lasiodiplodia hormozganensis TaxID=869390 RepID=A0AA40CJ57_9PEZI|nr:hypothetical protein DIS24_g9415 [Lasiodiplodia hormozganensis]